jgi:hypothetical protein
MRGSVNPGRESDPVAITMAFPREGTTALTGKLAPR